MAEIDGDDFREIQEFHRENYTARPQYDTLLSYVQQAYPILEEIAANRELIAYSELWEELGTNRQYITPILGTISHLEMRKGRPPLSAVVVRKDSNRPGENFMDLFTEMDAEHPYPGLSEDEAIRRILTDVYRQHAEK